MDSGGGRKYDHLVIDSNGIRKVINGVEYPGTEDDLRKKHQDSGCTKCKFVQSLMALLAYEIPTRLIERAKKKPLFVGKFHMPGWVGHADFYLFKCEYCGNVCVDYLHGGDQLLCPNCD